MLPGLGIPPQVHMCTLDTQPHNIQWAHSVQSSAASISLWRIGWTHDYVGCTVVNACSNI